VSSASAENGARRIYVINNLFGAGIGAVALRCWRQLSGGIRRHGINEKMAWRRRKWRREEGVKMSSMKICGHQSAMAVSGVSRRKPYSAESENIWYRRRRK
jgi:hypothetical protein